MQQPVSRRVVGEPALEASINGRVVDLESVSVDRELPDPLAGGSLRSASAELVVAEGQDVASTVATPWDPGTAWPPVPQSPASVSMDMGAGPVSLLGGGLVMSAAGGTSGREVDVEVADRYESLNRTISWDAVAGVMPGLEEASFSRYVGMTTTAITDHILRHCGWETTPLGVNYVMLDVPAQGSMWPRRGFVTESNRTDEGGFPYWYSSKWGVSVADVDATYTMLGGGYTLAGRGGVELSAMTQLSTASSPGTMHLDVQVGEPYGASIRLSWTDTNVFVRLRNPTGSYFTAVSVPRVDGLAYATVKYVSATSVQVILRSGGNSASEVVSVDAGLTSGAMNVARIWGQGRAGGFLVQAPNRLGGLEGWSPSAVIYPRQSNRNSLSVRPSIEGENCADLLAAQCEAEGATYWIDETGVLRWWDLGRLEEQSSVATLTSDDDIAETGFEWSHDLSRVKSRVAVRWREPLQARSWRTSIDLHQGRGETLQPGDVIEDWINVPDDEIWIMPDLSLSRVGDSYSDFNYGIGSWYGGVAAKTNGEDVDGWAQLDGSLLMTVERVTDRAFKTWIQWTGGSTNREATMRTLDKDSAAGTSLWRRRYGFDLPIIRGKLKFALMDRITYSAQSGPSTAPEHEIDAGWWIQSEAQAQYTADYAGARLTVPQPVLSSVALIPVPGLQLGDVVEVRDLHRTRLTVRGIVIEDSRSISADMGMSHQVAIRPTYVTRNGVTWEEWGQAMAGRSWETWGAQQAGKTWQEWGSAPLLGEDVV